MRLEAEADRVKAEGEKSEAERVRLEAEADRGAGSRDSFINRNAWRVSANSLEVLRTTSTISWPLS